MRKVVQPNGFTMVEILVAVIILAIGVLAVSQMTVMGMRTGTLINRQMYARDVLNRYYEMLQALPTSDSILLYRTSKSLNDTDTVTCDMFVEEITAGGSYSVIWNVADTLPDARFKTVRIYVIPRGAYAKRVLKSDLIKRY